MVVDQFYEYYITFLLYAGTSVFRVNNIFINIVRTLLFYYFINMIINNVFFSKNRDSLYIYIYIYCMFVFLTQSKQFLTLSYH